MGYDNEYVPKTIVLDIETTGIDQADDYLDPVEPAANLRDPAKIAADLAERTAARAESLALDWNVGRVVAIGTWSPWGGVDVALCQSEDDERAALEALWRILRPNRVLGFKVRTFDLPYLMQRSRLLDVPVPAYDLGRYARGSTITDLYDVLTFNDIRTDRGAMRRTLGAFCRRFGVDVSPSIPGAEVPRAVAEWRWSDVADHVRADVLATLDLARRLRVHL